MFRWLIPKLALTCCLLSGCMATSPFTKFTDSAANPTSDSPLILNDLSMNDLRELESQLYIDAQVANKEFIREQIAETPRGSQIGIYDESGGRYTGTVLRIRPDSIEMMNCISQEVISAPDGQQQCKTSHIPFQSFPISTVTHFSNISPPPAGFPTTDDELDGTEYSVAEIVNRSGTRQRWGKAPLRSSSGQTMSETTR